MKSLAVRAREMETIVQLGTDYQPAPETYLHALEVPEKSSGFGPAGLILFLGGELSATSSKIIWKYGLRRRPEVCRQLRHWKSTKGMLNKESHRSETLRRIFGNRSLRPLMISGYAHLLA